MDILAAMAERKEFQATDESNKAMENLFLASRVRSALAADQKTASVELEVKADSDTVYLKGKIRPASAVDTVIEVVGEVEGVREINQEGLGMPDYNV